MRELGAGSGSPQVNNRDVGWVGEGVRPQALSHQTGGAPASFQTAAPGRRCADWKFHHDRQQHRAKPVTLQPSPPEGAPRTRPLNSTSRRGLHRVPLPAAKQAAATPGATDAPDGAALCLFEGRDRPAGGGSTSASELAPGRRSATHAAPSQGLRPTQPSGSPQRRGPGEPTPRPRSYPSFRLAL